MSMDVHKVGWKWLVRISGLGVSSFSRQICHTAPYQSPDGLFFDMSNYEKETQTVCTF